MPTKSKTTAEPVPTETAAPAAASEQAWENIHARRQAAATAEQAQETAALQAEARELAGIPRGLVTDLTPIWREVGPWSAKLPGWTWLDRPLDRDFTAAVIEAGDHAITLAADVKRLAGPDVLKRLEGLETELTAPAALPPGRLAEIERELTRINVAGALRTLEAWRTPRDEAEREWRRVADVALGVVSTLALAASPNGAPPKAA